MEKQKIKFRVKGQELSYVNGIQRFASNIVKYIRIEIEADEEWAAFGHVEAIFQNDTRRVSMDLLLDEGVFFCDVPAEMGAKTSKVMLNLVGSTTENSSLLERVTTYPVFAFAIDSFAPTNGNREVHITPSMYDQFVANVDAKVAKIENLTVSAHLSEEAEVVKSSTPGGYYNLDFGIVRGEKGDDGFSPTVSVIPIDEGHSVTVTDKNGDHSFDVLDGWAGYINFEIDTDTSSETLGHLLYEYNDSTEVDFSISNGHLVMEVI